MKMPFSFAICLLSFSLTCLFGCSSPVEPDRAATAKSNYAALTAALEKEVETFRGKNFKRAIATAVYTKEEYRALVAKQSGSISAADRQRFNKVLQCEGLMRPNVDYFSGYDSLISDVTGGFYVDGTDSINVVLQDNVSGPTAEDSVTIFHELIHALQDQYFDLTALQNSVNSSDEHYSLKYVVEGEAELLCTYYAYKLHFGGYPSSSSPVMDAFTYYETWTEAFLDSVHRAGQPLFVQQPLMWAYYSYGPRFIDSVAGTTWSVIDNTIFASLPIKTAEVMHPSTYTTNRQEYLLDAVQLANYIGSSNTLDNDELGEMLTCVLFREWDFPAYKQIAQGLLADRIFVFQDPAGNLLSMAWYTIWADSLTGADFMANYASLVQKKKGITLHAPVAPPGQYIISDTADNVYIEQNGASVFVLENYPESRFSGLVMQMRGVKPYLRSLAKGSGAAAVRHPFVDKSGLTKGVWHDLRRPRRE